MQVTEAGNPKNEQNSPQWKESCDKYLSIKKATIETWFQNLQETDKQNIVEQFNLSSIEELDENYHQVGEMFFMTWNNPGDSHSALFKRLLEGKKALINPPPVLFSYPWYEVVESQTPVDCLNFQENNDKTICIGHTKWEIIEKISDIHLIVTHHQWKREGFQWTVRLYDTPISQSKTILYGTTMSGTMLFTYKDLYDDVSSMLNFEQNIYKFKDNEDEAQKIKNKYLKLYGEKGLVFYNSLLNRLSLAVENRIAQGKKGLFEGKELEEEIQKRILQRLGNDMYIKDELIYVKEWKIQRTFPETLNENFYLDI